MRCYTAPDPQIGPGSAWMKRFMTDACPPALSFEFDADSGALVAHFDPAAERPVAIDYQSLLTAIAEAGWAALYRDEEALQQLPELIARAEQPLQVKVAERRDATLSIGVNDDAMTATMDLGLAYGGEPIRREQVDAALREAGVVSGILEREIDQALALGVVQGRVVARGRPARPGQPARFESLIPDMQRRGPSVNERGIADYRELGTLVTVHVGDALMRRFPATAGVAGEDVLGLVVPAPAADDPPFAPGVTGAAPAQDDPDLLVAVISGQPVLQARGVSVLPTITVPAIDLNSGNIDFDGTVNVKGDVAPGMQVRASGDIFVVGAVEAAQLEAGGDITVAAGAIGHAHGGGAQAQGADLRARLVAGGTVSVLFCESAVVEAGGDIQIGEVALHSELTADNQIIIGKPGGRRSQLIGGAAKAAAMLQVGVLGSAAGVATRVEVGYNPSAYAELAALQANIAASEAKIESLNQVLAYTETLTDAHHRELRERAERTLAVAEKSHVEMLDRLAEAEASLVLSENPRILVGHTVHPGVDIRLGNKTTRTQDSGGSGMYMLEDDEIVFGNR
jgi:uncharacterized protein